MLLQQFRTETKLRYTDLNNAAIDKAILTNALSTEQQSKGGYSSAAAGSEIVESLGKELKDYPKELFGKLFKAIVDLNLGTGKYPEFTTYEEDLTNKEFAERDEILSRIGVKHTKTYFGNRYNLKEDEFELTTPSTGDPSSQIQQDKSPSEFSESMFAERSRSEEAADQLPDKLLQMQIEKTLKPVLDLINNSADFNEVEEKLSEIYPKMDPKGIENLLTKLIFISEIEGRLDSQNEL